MKPELTDQRATITRITPGPIITSLDLQWGGPDDRTITDFDLAKLGNVQAQGGCLQTGWVLLGGPCLLREGDTIPLVGAAETKPHEGPWVVVVLNAEGTPMVCNVEHRLDRAERTLESAAFAGWTGQVIPLSDILHVNQMREALEGLLVLAQSQRDVIADHPDLKWTLGNHCPRIKAAEQALKGDSRP